jgi:hypothetical protein
MHIIFANSPLEPTQAIVIHRRMARWMARDRDSAAQRCTANDKVRLESARFVAEILVYLAMPGLKSVQRARGCEFITQLALSQLALRLRTAVEASRGQAGDMRGNSTSWSITADTPRLRATGR